MRKVLGVRWLDTALHLFEIETSIIQKKGIAQMVFAATVLGL
jgi:hypothetical protein